MLGLHHDAQHGERCQVTASPPGSTIQRMRTCLRCQGLLRLEVIPRRRHAALELLACMACGDRTDARILQNRRLMVLEDQHAWKTDLWERIRTLNAQAQVPA